jgi:hypothetical protein
MRGTLQVFFAIRIIRTFTIKIEKLQLRGNISAIVARLRTRAA